MRGRAEYRRIGESPFLTNFDLRLALGVSGQPETATIPKILGGFEK